MFLYPEDVTTPWLIFSPKVYCACVCVLIFNVVLCVAGDKQLMDNCTAPPPPNPPTLDSRTSSRYLQLIPYINIIIITVQSRQNCHVVLVCSYYHDSFLMIIASREARVLVH